MKFSINRLKEPSTWAAVATLAMLFGISDQQADQIASAGAALAAIVAILLPAKGN